MMSILLLLSFCLSSSAAIVTKDPIVYEDLPCKFSLTAWNLTGPNVNTTGVPLVLGQNGATDGASYEITSTYATFPYNIYPTLSLSNGSIRAYRASGAWLTNATNVESGGLLTWYTSALFNTDAARIYTALQFANTTFRVLAAHGYHSLWSLCPFDGPLGQTSVLYNVSADTGITFPPAMNLGFSPRSCWAVRIYLVPLDNQC
ncbi:hypothetical protein B0H10DRAFT_1990941 [Mycena sp. CBHHK59/15]|nr:hypothetical protein B0H10DRAFT_1990941 [Mycena sp. CBHHK59/15]